MERESTDRTALREALRERTRSPPAAVVRRPARRPDTETLGQVVQFGLQRLDEAADALCSARTDARDALAYVRRLERDAWMPPTASALWASNALGPLTDWLAAMRDLYAAFWRGVVAVPSAVALWGTALGDPPTPRSVNRWLRAHFGTAPDPDQTPLIEPAEWAGAAADAVEALWRYAPAGDRVPDVWVARRTALWQRGACAPEALFVAALADDVPASLARGTTEDDPVLTRTAVLYAAERRSDDGPRHLRVVGHASSAVPLMTPARGAVDGAVPHSDTDGPRVFMAVGADTMLASLGMPSTVPWAPVEAVWRWLASIADDDRPTAGPISSLLAPPAMPTALQGHLSRGRLLAEAVRGAAADRARPHVARPAVATHSEGPCAEPRPLWQQHRSHLPWPSFHTRAFSPVLLFPLYFPVWPVVVGVYARARGAYADDRL
nr:hypothetical protein [Pandoravirus belohorizontensis]